MKHVLSVGNTFLLLLFILLNSCKEDDAAPALSIIDFDPMSGTSGTVVTITGTGFSEIDKDNNIVKFGNVNVVTLAATPTSLVVQAPASSSPVKISVTLFGETVESSSYFTSATKPTKRITGDLKVNYTFYKDTVYLIANIAYVMKGATLTIQPGTVIQGEKSTSGILVIERGALINAEGTASEPIVFTSSSAVNMRYPGDWGGLVICGYAAANNVSITAAVDTDLPKGDGNIRTRYSNYRGTWNDDDNSGILRYVRIEYAGAATPQNTAGGEMSSLSLYGVGRATTIDHVMVSYGKDDGLKCFGGTVNLKYYISYRTEDDDIDARFGYSGNIQFGIIARGKDIANELGSKAIESENDASATTSNPRTSAILSNITAIGPTATSVAGTASSTYICAVHLRRNTQLSLFNSVFVAWPTGIIVEPLATATNASINNLMVENNLFSLITSSTLVTTNPTGTTTVAKRREILFSGTALNANLTQNNQISVNDSTNAFGTRIGPTIWYNNNGNYGVASAVYDAQAFVPGTLSAPGTYAPNFTTFTSGFTPKAADFNDGKLKGSIEAPNQNFEVVDFIGAVGLSNSAQWTGGWVEWNPHVKVY